MKTDNFLQPEKTCFIRGRQEHFKCVKDLKCCCWFEDGRGSVMRDAGGLKKLEESSARKPGPQPSSCKEVNPANNWMMSEVDSPLEPPGKNHGQLMPWFWPYKTRAEEAESPYGVWPLKLWDNNVCPLKPLRICLFAAVPKVSRYTISFGLDTGIKLYVGQSSLKSPESNGICCIFHKGVENEMFHLWKLKAVFKGSKINFHDYTSKSEESNILIICDTNLEICKS